MWFKKEKEFYLPTWLMTIKTVNAGTFTISSALNMDEVPSEFEEFSDEWVRSENYPNARLTFSYFKSSVVFRSADIIFIKIEPKWTKVDEKTYKKHKNASEA